jgi:hypothetical protein
LLRRLWREVEEGKEGEGEGNEEVAKAENEELGEGFGGREEEK